MIESFDKLIAWTMLISAWILPYVLFFIMRQKLKNMDSRCASLKFLNVKFEYLNDKFRETTKYLQNEIHEIKQELSRKNND